MLKTVRIRLIIDLPVHPKHGARAGNEYDAKELHLGPGNPKWEFTGSAGEAVRVFAYEAEKVKRA